MHYLLLLSIDKNIEKENLVDAVEKSMLPYCDYFEDGPSEYCEFQPEDWEPTENHPTKSEWAEDHGYVEHKGAYGFWINPKGCWDWYQIGGRWAGQLPVKADFQERNVDTGERSWTNKETAIDPLMFDVARVSSIDLTKDSSLINPFAFGDNESWNERRKWTGEAFEENTDHEERFADWFKSLDPESWLVVVDYHN